ncbi:hypothetical protein IX51_06345 [uncultured archaeon]|nr:hypothetical protein IX51_06345 [uncultured archaeon]HKJ96954.1 hypothetical protein [Thermoplasmataceae archaeon]
MSTSDQKQGSNEKQNSQNSTVIEIKISIPPFLGGNVGSLFDHLGQAAKELAKAGRSFISAENQQPVKMRKIEIK